jgi:crossover junction endodeoxyribonuclease RuvC
MIVIGIDPGVATTGYGIIKEEEDLGLSLLEYGIIRTSTSKSTPERLLDLYQQLIDLISLHRPNYGAVEKLFFQKNVRTAMIVGQALGVIELALAYSKVPIQEYTPLEIKQAVVGYGAADKNQVQQMVRTLLNLSELPRPDDAADALAIAITHIHTIKMYKFDNQD